MSNADEKRKEMLERAKQVAKDTDDKLMNELQALRDANHTDLEKLCPRVADEAVCQQLIDIVAESTRNNESLAQLKERIERLGDVGLSVAEELIKLVKAV